MLKSEKTQLRVSNPAPGPTGISGLIWWIANTMPSLGSLVTPNIQSYRCDDVDMQ